MTYRPFDPAMHIEAMAAGSARLARQPQEPRPLECCVPTQRELQDAAALMDATIKELAAEAVVEMRYAV